MLRLSRCVSKHEIQLKQVYAIRLSAGRYSSSAETNESDSSPPRKKGGVFWKLLGLTIAGAGGVVGYAWYDSNFRKTVEESVPYSRDAFSYLFQFAPDSPHSIAYKASSIDRSELKALEPKPELSDAVAVVPDPTPPKPVEEIAKPVESKKEIAAREAREKKEQAQKLLREREAQEAAENLALETGLESLLSNASRSVEEATSAHRAAAAAVRLHTEQLRKAMEEDAPESSWDELTFNHQTRADSTWSSQQADKSAGEWLDKLRHAVADGRASSITKRNKAISAAEKEVARLNKELSSAASELAKAHADAKKLSDYRDLVKIGKEQFKKELEELESISEGTNSSELNSLIVHAHSRIDQLRRQLVEKQALEPVRIQTALDAANEQDERRTSLRLAAERDKAAAQLAAHRQRWESEAAEKFEAELRHQLARHTAAHSDHLVDALHSQRANLLVEFDTQLTNRVEAEKYRMQAEVADSLARMKAIEAAIEGRAEKVRVTGRDRDLWLACRALAAVIEQGRSGNPSDRPTRICAEIGAVRQAGSEHPIVHVALSTVPDVVHQRGIFTIESLSQRFTRVRTTARRVAIVDEASHGLGRYLLSYIQSFFVLRTRPIRGDENASDLSTFALLDNAEYSLRRGDLEQAVRFVNGLRGEFRRVASSWLDEARIVLELKQAVELLTAFASASGLESLD